MRRPPVRVGLIGSQFITSIHAEALKAVANAEANLRQIQLAEDALRVQKHQLAVETERLNQMRIVLDKYTIRSPCDCTVQTRLIRAGEYVTPGAGVATLLDPLDKYVRIYIPVPDLGKVRVGDRVRIEPDATPGEFFPGEDCPLGQTLLDVLQDDVSDRHIEQRPVPGLLREPESSSGIPDR